MTPPDTPTDDDQKILSPQTGKSPVEEQSDINLGPEINNAIKSLMVETNTIDGENKSQDICIQNQSPSLQDDFIGNTQVLTLEVEPLSNERQDTNVEFPVSQGPNLVQNGALIAHELDTITGSFSSLIPETNQSQTSSSLLDSILYDSMRDQSVVQQVSFGSHPPIYLAILGDSDIINGTGPSDSNMSSSNVTHLPIGTTDISLSNSSSDKREKPDLFPTISTTNGPLPILETTTTSVPGNVEHRPMNSQLLERTAQSEMLGSTIPPFVSGATSIFLDTFIDHITNIYNHYDAHGSDFFQQIHRLFLEYLVSICFIQLTHPPCPMLNIKFMIFQLPHSLTTCCRRPVA